MDWCYSRIKNLRFSTERLRKKALDPVVAKAPKVHRSAVLPAQVRTQPHSTPPEVDQGTGGRSVLVVLPVQADQGALVQALHPVAVPANGHMG